MFPDLKASGLTSQTPAPVWRTVLAAAAGAWLGKRLKPASALLAGAVALALLPRRKLSLPAAEIAPVEEEDSPWPKAPMAQPFVPHTQAWDELREALSPVLHAPEAPTATASNTITPENDELIIEGLCFEATQPFILDDEEDSDTRR